MAANGKSWAGAARILIVLGVLVVAYGLGYVTKPAPADWKAPTIAPGPGYTEALPAVGPADAKVVVQEVVDLKCPHCGRRNAHIKRMLAEHGHDVLFVLKFFPFVEFKPPRGLFASEDGAIAALAAHRQGKLFEYIDLLYLSRRDPWTPEALQGFATKIGLDEKKFAADLRSEELCLHVRTDKLAATDLRVEATPTLFINGRKVPMNATVEDIRRMIRAATASVDRILEKGEAATVTEARGLDAARHHPAGALFAKRYTQSDGGGLVDAFLARIQSNKSMAQKKQEWLQTCFHQRHPITQK